MKDQHQSLPDGIIKSDEAMRMFGYADRSAFWKAIKRDRVPFVRMNRRRCVFEPAALRAWLDSHTVGQSSQKGE